MRIGYGLAGLLALPVLVAACWSSPTGPTAAGAASVDDAGNLRYWLGAVCEDVVYVEVELVDSEGDRTLDTWIVTAAEPGQPLEYLTVGEVPHGFTEAESLVVNWAEADVVRVGVHAAEPERSSSGEPVYPDPLALTHVSVDRVVDEADDHVDEWFVQDRGWYTRDGYRDLANDDDMVYPFCATPER